MKLAKIKDAQVMGQYKPTTIDERKKAANFLVKSANGGSYTIDPRNLNIKKGRGVKCVYENGYIEVTEAKLKSLKKAYTWETDC